MPSYDKAEVEAHADEVRGGSRIAGALAHVNNGDGAASGLQNCGDGPRLMSVAAQTELLEVDCATENP